MRKNLSTIILILIFLVGLSVMLYPSVSDAVNRKHQSRAVADYSEKVEQLSDADYQTYFDAADAYNRQLNTTPNAFYKPDLVGGYAQTLDISGTGIMGYITIPKISVKLPIYHGTDEAAGGSRPSGRQQPARGRCRDPCGHISAPRPAQRKAVHQSGRAGGGRPLYHHGVGSGADL